MCEYVILYKNNGYWGLHHGQVTNKEERGTHNKEQGMEIVLGLDTDNSDV
jgi:hypothetical protein